MEQTSGINKKTSLFFLAWPIFIELVLQMLVGNIDQIMLSHYSENSVAAVGNANTIMNFLTITFSIITLAITIMITQYLGSKNKDKVSEIYTVGTFTNVCFSVVIGFILLVACKPIFTLMNMPPELMAEAKIYTQIVGGFVFLQAISLSFSSIFRSNGLMKETMYVSIIVNIINIVGNAILLYGLFGLPQLGIMGIAISSVFSRFIGLIIIGYLFVKKVDGEISLKYLRPFPKDTFKQLIKIGLPAGGESVAWNISQMVILSFVNIFGTTVVTARVYANMIAWFSFIYSSAVSQANQIVVGHLIGARDEEGAYERSLKTLRPAMIITFIVSTLVFIFSDYIFGIFTSNQEILTILKTITFIEIFLELGRCANLVFVRAMQAAGDTKYPVVLGIGSAWVISTLLAYVLGILLGWGLAGIWIAMALDECLRAIIFYIRWKKGGWRNKAII